MTEVNNAIQFLTDYATQNNLNYSEDEILSVVIMSLFTNSHVRDIEFKLNQNIPNDAQTFYNNTIEKFGGILQIFRVRENINKND
ncbi:hypothetical protein [Flammeovirga sp. SJP92]|uniref:hypothetical protein n=1 Tax=Flammeovirga sp. SJP92 TaxID=1775430 RepID=UPI000787B92E|nr:hypothetical protein [Flammeovirga sp. SJP92]KXX70380.1 hypothetical protein AVL50_11635 [Flammeovirga sp. SJP92]